MELTVMCNIRYVKPAIGPNGRPSVNMDLYPNVLDKIVNENIRIHSMHPNASAFDEELNPRLRFLYTRRIKRR